MNRRHVLPLLAAAAVLLCAVFVIRTLGEGDLEEDADPVEAAPPPARAVLRTEPDSRPAMRTTKAAPAPKPLAEPPAETAETADLTGLEEAEAALAHLARLLRDRKASNEDLLGALASIQTFYLHPPPPHGFVLHTPPPHGSNAERSVVLDANLQLLAEEQRWPYDYVDEILKWRRRAEKQILRALKLQEVDRKERTNAREAVNVKAAQVLASTGNPALSRDIIRTLERAFLKAKYEVSQALYDETFGALAQLGHPDSLEWMREEFTHGRKSSTSKVDQLIAAHRAMVRFDRDAVDGSERHKLVKEMIKTYAGLEALAAQRSDDDQILTARAFWKRVGPGAIRVAQYYANDPQSDDEEPLDTMAELMVWFRHHKNHKKPPWQDE